MHVSAMVKTHGMGAMCFALSAICTVGNPAGARASTSSIAVFELHVGEASPMSRTYAQRIIERLGAEPALSVLPRADVLAALSPQFPGLLDSKAVEEALAPIVSALRVGEKLVYSDADQALQVLQAVRADLTLLQRRSPDTVMVSDALFSALMMLVTTHYFDDRLAEASGVMEEVVERFGTSREVTDDSYHPKVVALYDDAVANRTGAGTSTLTVTTVPEGAELIIDGRLMTERSPARFPNLLKGRHDVMARLDDGRIARRIVTLADDTATVQLDIPLHAACVFNDDIAGLTFDDIGAAQAGVVAVATRLGQLLGVEAVIVSGLMIDQSDAQLLAYAVDVSEGRLKAAPLRVAVPTDTVRPQAVQQVSELGLIASPKASTAWLSNYVGWTLSGVGVLALSSGLGVLGHYLGQKDEYDRGRALYSCSTPGVSRFANALEQCAAYDEQRGLLNAESAASGVLIGVGAAALIGGVVAFLLMDDDALSLQNTSPRLHPTLRYVGPVSLPSRGRGAGLTLEF